MNIRHRRFAGLIVILALLGQLFVLSPAWAHPGHDNMSHHMSEDANLYSPADEHAHGHDHHQMKQKQAPAAAPDCCEGSDSCSCPAGTCSSASALFCQPQALSSSPPLAIVATAYLAFLFESPVGELFRPPIHA